MVGYMKEREEMKEETMREDVLIPRIKIREEEMVIGMILVMMIEVPGQRTEMFKVVEIIK